MFLSSYLINEESKIITSLLLFGKQMIYAWVYN